MTPDASKSPIPLADYYEAKPLSVLVKELSVPGLTNERHRDQVNKLVINLVIQYIAEYIGAPMAGIEEIQTKAEQLLQQEKGARGKGAEYMINILERLMTGDQELDNGDNSFANECLFDIHSTSAILKEIIFASAFDKKSSDFVGLDLGTGSGILMIGQYIAAQRARMHRVTLLGLERQKKSVDNAMRVLGRAELHAQVDIAQADIRRRDVMGVFEGMPLSSFVSETFSTQMAEMHVKDGRLRIPDSHDNRIALMTQDIGDPFPRVLENTVNGRPRFIRDVMEGKTAMFPDIVNGNFAPSLKSTKLRMTTGLEPKRHVPISRIGSEFERFEALAPEQKRFPPVDAGKEVDELMSKLLQEIGNG